VDTSMGFTPLEGVVMGTRSGDFGAGAVEYYCKQSGDSVGDTVKKLNTQSGMKGLCGTNDMREIVKNMQNGDEKAQLAFDVFLCLDTQVHRRIFLHVRGKGGRPYIHWRYWREFRRCESSSVGGAFAYNPHR